ncbi:MAG: SRPBCC family protein [Verrucomicrobiota bacterium]
MKINKDLEIAARPEEVWEVIGGTHFGNVALWSSDVLASQGSVESGRRECETSIGGLRETVTRHNSERRQLSYRVVGDKMPFFVKHLENNWDIDPGSSPNHARVRMRLEAKLLFPFNLLMAPMMGFQFRSILKRTLEEFKHFVETGEPHPRKEEASARAKQEPLATVAR